MWLKPAAKGEFGRPEDRDPRRHRYCPSDIGVYSHFRRDICERDHAHLAINHVADAVSKYMPPLNLEE